MKNTISILFVLLGVILFTSCSENNSKSSTKKEAEPKPVNVDSLAVVKGKEIAQASFKVLKGELMKAVSQGGPVAGVEICSSKAMLISDSLSEVYGVNIKRASLKNRNPKNSATETEKKVLLSWEEDAKSNVELSPRVLHADNGDVQFFAPIKTASLCLNCHGDLQNMNSALKGKISEYYPDDLAHGYAENQLRGAWSITFPKSYFEKEQ